MVICLIFIDQIVKFSIIKNLYNSSKIILNGILNLTYVENTGGVFGIGKNCTMIFIITNIIVLTLITTFVVLRKNQVSIYGLIGFALILAGGIGNLFDRLFRGFVVDYIDFSPLIKYPVFNIADVCIVVGSFIIGINLIVDLIKERKYELGEVNERIQNK